MNEQRFVVSDILWQRLEPHLPGKVCVDLSRFDAAPLIAFTATKEIDYGTETDG